MSRKYKYLILLLLLPAGCRLLPDVPLPRVPGLAAYSIDIQQGNVVTQEMLGKLQPGMTRSQVRFVLGTPLLVDPFRTDRWDYIYTLSQKGGRVEQRQLKVYFIDDKMVRFEGDGVAATKPAAVPAPQPESKSTPKADTAKPAVTAPAGAAVEAPPQLRLAPTEGEPARPDELRLAEPAAPVAAQPAPAPSVLEAPPLPRLNLPPEPEEPARAGATTLDTPGKP